MLELKWTRKMLRNQRQLSKKDIEMICRIARREEMTEIIEKLPKIDFIYINFDRNTGKDEIKIWLGQNGKEEEKSVTISKKSMLYLWLNRFCKAIIKKSI